MMNSIRQFATFCGVGVINTIVGLGTILVLSEILGVHYITSNICGYALGLTVSFFLNRRLTFKASRSETKRQITLFLTVFAIAYGCQFATLVFLVKIIGLSNLYSQIIACGVYTVIGFAGNKFITFRAKV